jgi:hypothetical protein
MKAKNTLSPEQIKDLFSILKHRFENNMRRHEGLDWEEIQERLIFYTRKLWSLHEMERTGGEPDVVGLDLSTDEFIFYDCSAESPKGRRSLCYDKKALESRKKFKPKNNVVDMATTMGIDLVTKEEYLKFQHFGPFDSKTSSWLKTPIEIRDLGGAIFSDYRYGHVFVYHNGAESYYAARGFRGLLRV